MVTQEIKNRSGRDSDRGCSFSFYGSLGLLVLMAVALGGCKVDQQKEVATYRDVLASESGLPRSLEPNQPLSLPYALDLANAHNEQLAIKGEQYLQALIDKDRAVALFLPTVSYAPTYARQEKVTIAGAPSFVGEFIPPHTFDQPVSARMNVNVLADAAQVRRAGRTAEQQRSLLLDLKSTILLDVARVYYQVLLSEAQVRVLEYSVTVQQARVANIEHEFNVGTALAVDVSQAQAQLAQTKVSLVKAGSDAANGRATLAFLIGVPSVEGLLVDQLDLPEEVPSKEQLISAAWRRREDLIAAQYQVGAAVYALRQAWSRYFPAVSVDFTYFLSRQSFPSDARWMGTLQVNLPIFSAGLIHADVRTAWSQLRQAKLAQSYLQRRIDEQLEIALENYRQVGRQIEDLSVQVAAAEKAVKQADQEYEVGVALNLDRLIAQDQLLRAQLAMTNARFAHKIYYLDLVRTLGQFDASSLQGGLASLSAEAGTGSDWTGRKNGGR